MASDTVPGGEEGTPGEATQRRVLVLASYFSPGFKAGGPIRSLLNLMQVMGGGYDFYILTRDHDLSDAGPYPGIETMRWLSLEGARWRVFFAPERQLTWRLLRRLIEEIRPDVVYANSHFDPLLTLQLQVLRRLGGIDPAIRCVVAPRGELLPGALAISSRRKRAVLWLQRRLSLHDGIVWQATSEAERQAVMALVDQGAEVVLAPDPLVPPPEAQIPESSKRPGSLRLVFLSRVAQNKGVVELIQGLKAVRGEVSIDLYGPREDPNYWAQVEEAIEALPAHVQARYRGSIPHEQVWKTLQGYDAFVLLTHGENFGHAIVEALLAGLPVILSDRTQWQDVEARGVGWTLSLQDNEGFVRLVERCVVMGPTEHDTMRKCAFQYGMSLCEQQQLESHNALLGKP